MRSSNQSGIPARPATGRKKPPRYAWLFAMAAAGIAIISNPATADERPPAVSVVTAREGELADRIRVVGSLVAREESVVKVDLDDIRIVSVEAEAGDFVEKGDVLARLDATLIAIEQEANVARLARAEAAVAQARSQIDDAALAHDQARADMERSRTLQTKGFAAEETLETRLTALKRAASALALAKQTLGVAQAERQIILADGQEIAARLERTIISAPTDGRILRRTAKVGDMTSASGEPMFVIAENGEIEMDAEVTEMEFARLAVGQTATIVVSGQPEVIKGNVRLLAPELQVGSRLGRARIQLSRADGLSVNAFARGEVEVGRRGGVFLPAASVDAQDGKVFAQIVWKGAVEVRQIETGLRKAGLVEIRSGLSVGEMVVLRAGNFLVSGDRVSPIEVAYPTVGLTDRPILTSDAAR